jgi:predicted NodU family carbamoyl transferase
LPSQAIDYCLEEGRLSLNNVEHVAINRKPGVNNWRRIGFVLTHWPHPKPMWQKIKNIRSAASVKQALESKYQIELKAQVHHVEHHLAHLASAFLFPASMRRRVCQLTDLAILPVRPRALAMGKSLRLRAASTSRIR